RSRLEFAPARPARPACRSAGPTSGPANLVPVSASIRSHVMWNSLVRKFRRPRPSSAKSRRPRRTPLSLEPLEDRLVLSCDNPFKELAQDVKPYLDNFNLALQKIVQGANAQLPIVNKSLKDLLGASDLVSGLSDFQGVLQTTLDGINDPNTLAPAV